MAQLHAPGDALGEASELFAHRLAHRLQRLEPRAATGHVDAQAAGRAVADHGEDGKLSIPESEASRGVDAPHLVGPPGQDGSLVPLRLDRLRLPLRRQQFVLAHQAQHAPQRRPHAGQPQPRPNLAVAFAVEGRGLDRAPDLPGELLIRVARLRAAPGGRGEACKRRRW